VEIKQAACRLPLEEFLELQCNANTCPYGGSCVEDTTIKSCKILREKIWGCFNAEPPTSLQRKKFIESILDASYVRSTGKFEFIAGGSFGESGGVRLVCEAAYLILLGLSKERNASQCSYQWRNTRNKIIGNVKNTK